MLLIETRRPRFLIDLLHIRAAPSEMIRIRSIFQIIEVRRLRHSQSRCPHCPVQLESGWAPFSMAPFSRWPPRSPVPLQRSFSPLRFSLTENTSHERRIHRPRCSAEVVCSDSPFPVGKTPHVAELVVASVAGVDGSWCGTSGDANASLSLSLSRARRQARRGVESVSRMIGRAESLEDRALLAVSILGTSATTPTTVTNSSSTQTISNFVVEAGDDRLLVVSTGVGSPLVSASVSFGGTSLTEVIRQDTNTNLTSRIFTLPLGDSDSATTGDVVLTLSGNSRNFAVVTAFSGVDQATSVTTASNQSASLTIASAVGDMGWTQSSIRTAQRSSQTGRGRRHKAPSDASIQIPRWAE